VPAAAEPPFEGALGLTSGLAGSAAGSFGAAVEPLAAPSPRGVPEGSAVVPGASAEGRASEHPASTRAAVSAVDDATQPARLNLTASPPRTLVPH
jgi:hypothetical protein